MKLKVIVHKAEEGDYWAEVPSIPGCVIQGETIDELLGNLHEAVNGCLIVEMEYFTCNREEQNNGDSGVQSICGKYMGHMGSKGWALGCINGSHHIHKKIRQRLTYTHRTSKFGTFIPSPAGEG